MHILMLVQGEQRTIFTHLYSSMDQHCELDLRRVAPKDQKSLAKYFKDIDPLKYDRIILFLRFKKEIRQLAFIRTLPNLVILEMDAWQNYYPDSKYFGKFSRHYRHLPWSRQIVSGFTLRNKLIAEGFDTHFVSKGYDDSILRNLNIKRDIEFGFLGSTKNKMYQRRKEILEDAVKRFNLKVSRTASGQEYLETLNRIKYFLSCDCEFGEYMLKNYEAMACGCIVFAWNQGDVENNALGFKDMINVVLYTSLDEISNKLNILKNNPELEQAIAKAGQELVENKFRFSVLGKQIVETAALPLREKAKTNYLIDKIRFLFYR